MRKSDATTAAPSSTLTAARLSPTNQSSSLARKARSSTALRVVSGRCSIWNRIEVTRSPGAMASQSGGNTPKASASKARFAVPSAKAIQVVNSVWFSHFSPNRPSVAV